MRLTPKCLAMTCIWNVRESLSQSCRDLRNGLKASVMAPNNIDTLSVRYTMCISIAVSLKAKVRHARFAVHRQHRTNHPSR